MKWNNGLRIAVAAYVLCSAGLALVTIKRHMGKDFSSMDISYYHQEGVRIARGENPYERILQGNMRENQKYPTALPLLYLFSAATCLTVGERYHDFQLLWTPICVLSHFAIGLLLLLVLGRRCGPVYGVLAGIYWALGRWPMTAMTGEFVDPLALLVFLLSLVLYRQRPKVSCLVFGTSLAIKHLALFVTPLLIIWEFCRGESDRAMRRSVVALMLIALVPAAVSLPFIVWSPEGFLRSIMFSGTRLAEDALGASSIDARLGIVGPAGRLPLLAVMLLLYVATFQGVLRPWGSAAFCFAIFLSFNPVVFPVYVCWLVALVPLAVAEWIELRPSATPLPAVGR